MNTKHSEPFYISSNLFDNRRLRRRISKWMERLRERQQFYMTHSAASKTDRSRRRCHLMVSRRHVAAALPADITIDLLSDDDGDDADAEDISQPTAAKPPAANGLFRHGAYASPGSLQLSNVPNITLVPVDYAPAQNSTSMHLMPRKSKRYGDVTSRAAVTASTLNESIVLTSDDEDIKLNHNRRQLMRSPPPLAPLTFSDTIEEVTVSLVPRSSTTANCQARQRRRQPCELSFNSHPSSCSTPTITSPKNHFDGFLRVDVPNEETAALPDETTVHTVIANRIYELSLSKLREGLASSGVPEYAHDMLPEQLQKLSPAMRAKVAPMVAPSPPAPISLKLSSDLSISLISDDDDCDNGNAGAGMSGCGVGKNISDLLQPVMAAEAHAAAKLLKQQQPQLSVVQHLQYPGHGSPVALPVMALATTPPTVPTPSSTRRRKLG
ncbi:protein a6 [Drosophila hydei]|uniref:Protein a6 n=1 Tax=Drosophila hydei TaxID=7224 RepID=A0A6J1L304_DROHY|nr:protein a6 [Drosophila hydei]